MTLTSASSLRISVSLGDSTPPEESTRIERSDQTGCFLTQSIRSLVPLFNDSSETTTAPTPLSISKQSSSILLHTRQAIPAAPSTVPIASPSRRVGGSNSTRDSWLADSLDIAGPYAQFC